MLKNTCWWDPNRPKNKAMLKKKGSRRKAQEERVKKTMLNKKMLKKTGLNRKA